MNTTIEIMTHTRYILLFGLLLARCASSTDDVTFSMNKKKHNLEESIKIVRRMEEHYSKLSDSATEGRKMAWADSAEICRRQIEEWKKEIAGIDLYQKMRNNP